MHVLGFLVSEDKIDGRVIYHSKSHHDKKYVDIWKQSHIHLSLTALDSGPMTLNESLHYRIPFIYSNNCAAYDYISKLGKCGEIVEIDPPISDARTCQKLCPITNAKYYDRELDYEKIMVSVDKVINNYDEYTSWSWNDQLNYDTIIDKWMNVFLT